MEYEKAMNLIAKAATEIKGKFFGYPFSAYPRVGYFFDRRMSLSLSFHLHNSEEDKIFKNHHHALSWSPEEGEEKLKHLVDKVNRDIEVCYRVVDESMANDTWWGQESYDNIKDAKEKLFEISRKTLISDHSARIRRGGLPSKIIVLDRYAGGSHLRVPIFSLKLNSDYHLPSYE